MITVDEVTKAYNRLVVCMEEYDKYVLVYSKAKKELEYQKLIGLYNGTIDGKNAEIREASARLLLADLYNSCEQAEDSMNKAKLDLDIAKLEVELLRTILRIYEVEKE